MSEIKSNFFLSQRTSELDAERQASDSNVLADDLSRKSKLSRTLVWLRSISRKPQIKGEYKENNLGRQICEAVGETLSRSSIHGFPNISSTTVNWLAKLIWFICIVLSWGYLILQISKSLQLYNQRGVVSSTSIVYEAPTDFFGKLIATIFYIVTKKYS